MSATHHWAGTIVVTPEPEPSDDEKADLFVSDWLAQLTTGDIHPESLRPAVERAVERLQRVLDQPLGAKEER